MTKIEQLLKNGVGVDEPIKILHIGPEYKITYFINRPGSLIRSPIPLKEAIKFLKTEKFDLILSEPHNKAILNPQSHLLTEGSLGA